jgi:hypothetical protein
MDPPPALCTNQGNMSLMVGVEDDKHSFGF